MGHIQEHPAKPARKKHMEVGTPPFWKHVDKPMGKMGPNSVNPPTNLQTNPDLVDFQGKTNGCIWAVTKTLVICCIWILILPSYITGLFLLAHEIRICLQLNAVFHGSCQPKITASNWKFATRLAGCSCTDDSWCPKSRIGTTAQGVKMIYLYGKWPWFGEQWKFFLSPKYSGWWWVV